MNVLKRLKAGIAAHRKGRLQVAFNAYQDVLKADPENPDALNFMGMLAHQSGDNDKAIALLRKSLQVSPENPSAQINLGNILFEAGKPGDAAEAFVAAIRLDPTMPEGYQNLGVLYRRIGRLEEAAQLLRQAAEFDPKNAENWHNLGICYLQMQKPEEATDAFEACVKLGIRDQLNAVWHARMLCAMGRTEVARAHLERHLARDPDDVVARHHLAAIKGETADRVPEEYVRQHFDAFARSFDETLGALDYRAPEIVAAEVQRWRGDRPPAAVVVDLGCGTGLCGPLIAAHCEKLIGVDLSPKMLLRAAKVGAYHELHEADLVGFLAGLPDDHVDFAVSADTLIYLGDLAPLMAELGRTLRPGGALVATFEVQQSGDGDLGYRILEHGRYGHTQEYLAGVAADAGLAIFHEHHEVLRREATEDVTGLIVTFERPAA